MKGSKACLYTTICSVVPIFDQVVKSQTEKNLAGLTAEQFVVFRRVTGKMLAHTYIDLYGGWRSSGEGAYIRD